MKAYAVLRNTVCVLCALFWAGLFFLTPPAGEGAAVGGDTYLCRWENGTETEETYYDAYFGFVGWENDDIVIERGGMRGEISPSEACKNVLSVLEAGNFGETCALSTDGITRLERAALYRRYYGRSWYAEKWFDWTGEGLAAADARSVEEAVLLEGAISPEQLNEVGAKTLYLRKAAAFDENTLVGTKVEKIFAQEPYRADGETVCLITAGGVRLLAGLPLAESIEVPQDIRYADEGALIACTQVREIAVPFVGSAKNPVGSAYRGEFAHLFSTGEAYKVPQTLRKVRVTGGYLASHAFYACPMLEEIDACGLLYDNIEYDAFVDCPALRLVHTPRGNVHLQGQFKVSIAPCGCTVFERVEEGSIG